MEGIGLCVLDMWMDLADIQQLTRLQESRQDVTKCGKLQIVHSKSI